MLPLILTVIHGIMEYVKHVPIDIGSMLMESANMLQINVILGITLMDYVRVVMLDMILLMVLAKFLLKIFKDLLIKDVKLGIKEFVSNVHLDGL